MRSCLYRFGPFLLDPAKREFWRDGTRVPLQLKVFDCLAYLVANRERAVGRDELIAAVWGKVDVTDNVLGQIVGRTRHAVDDTGEEQRSIRTVVGFGYRWVAPVESIEPVAGPDAVTREDDRSAPVQSVDAVQPVDAAPSPRVRRRVVGYRAVAAIALVLVGVGALGLATMMQKPRDVPVPVPAPDASRPQASREGMALVLPLRIKAGSEFAWMRLGVMDLIAERLRVEGQPVVPSDNVVALLHGSVADTSDRAQIERLTSAASATFVIDARAELVAGRWRVSLHTVSGGQPPLAATADSTDILVAARTATDRLALALGLSVPDDEQASAEDNQLALFLQKLKAATLAGHLDQARQLFDRLDAGQRAQPEVRYRLAQIDIYSGHLDAAQTELTALLAATSARDNPVLRARILTDLGNVFLWRDEDAHAEHSADEAVNLSGTSQAPRVVGAAFLVRAMARAKQARYADALADFTAAHIAMESAGDTLTAAQMDVDVAIYLDLDRDRMGDALARLNSAADRLASFGDTSGELNARVVIAYIHLALLDPATALAGVERMNQLAAGASESPWRRYADLVQVEVLEANGRLRAADALLQRATDSAERNHDAASRAWAQAIAARHALRAGKPAQAAAAASAALQVAWDAKFPREYARTWLTLVQARIVLGQTQAAASTIAAAATWAKHHDSTAARVYTTLAKAEEIAASGGAGAARADFEQALSEADAGRVPLDIVQVAQPYVANLIADGDLRRAGTVAARVAEWSEQDYAAALPQLRFYHAFGNATAWQAAFDRAHALAGERPIPAEIAMPPPAAADVRAD